MVRKINKDYAVIYADYDGMTLKEESLGFVLPEIVTDYYTTPGPIQWNYYIFIPEEKLVEAKWFFANPDKPTVQELKNLKMKILTDTAYARKCILPMHKIDDFIERHFPKFNPERCGHIVLLKGLNYELAKVRSETLKATSLKSYKLIKSFYRDHSLLFSLNELDIIRKDLLTKPRMKVIYYTHITNEFNVAKQKFDFLGNHATLEIMK